MTLQAEIDRVVARLARNAPKLRRYADQGLSQRIIQKIERDDKIRTRVQSIMERRFIFESRQVPGARWRALNPKYRAWKARQGYSTKIGTRTGALGKAAIKAVRTTWRIKTGANWRGNLNLAGPSRDYADYFGDVRPWDLDPTKAELKPVESMALKLVNQELRRMARG